MDLVIILTDSLMAGAIIGREDMVIGADMTMATGTDISMGIMMATMLITTTIATTIITPISTVTETMSVLLRVPAEPDPNQVN